MSRSLAMALRRLPVDVARQIEYLTLSKSQQRYASTFPVTAIAGPSRIPMNHFPYPVQSRLDDALNAIRTNSRSAIIQRGQQYLENLANAMDTETAGGRKIAKDGVRALLEPLLHEREYSSLHYALMAKAKKLGLLRALSENHTFRIAEAYSRDKAWRKSFLLLAPNATSEDSMVEIVNNLFYMQHMKRKHIVEWFIKQNSPSLAAWAVLVQESNIAGALQLLEAFTRQSMDLGVKDIEGAMGLYEHVMLRLTQRKLRSGSPIPTMISRDLVKILGGPHFLSARFTTLWMRAERIAQNYHSAQLAWEVFDLHPRPNSIQLHMLDDKTVYSPQVTADAWKEYFKLKKAMGRGSENLAELTRKSFETVPIYYASTRQLNSILQAICATPKTNRVPVHNLPLLAVMLRQFESAQDELGPAPDARTINLAAAGLARLWRSSSGLLDPVFGIHQSREVRRDRVRRRFDGITPSEWRLVGDAADELKAEKGSGKINLPLKPMKRHWDRVKGSLSSSDPDGTALRLLRPITALVEQCIKFCLAEKYVTESEDEVDEMFESMMEELEARVIPTMPIAWVKHESGQWEAIRADPENGEGCTL